MKKIFLMVAILATALLQTGFAQHNHPNHQNQTPALLPLYYNLKDALVVGNSNLAASKAAELVKVLNMPKAKTIAGTNRVGLLKHAQKINGSKDLKSQRANFALLSADMVVLAKRSKLSTGPVYQMYCPMQKASWLSSNTTVKNPYFGNAMLTCGKVVENLSNQNRVLL